MDGCLEVFLVGIAQDIWHNWQIRPGGAWSGWERLGKPDDKGTSLAVGRNADGSLEVFLVGTAKNIWHASHMTTLRIHAVRMADSDGTRQTAITPEQVWQWTGYANRVFKAARMQFLYPPNALGPDWTERRSTALNNLKGGDDPQEARDLANDNPGKIVVLFRTGDPTTPVGGCGPGCGFSGGNLSYVIMPAFDTRVCNNTKQNLGLFAHELGHFFDLGHTHKEEFATVAAATNKFQPPGQPTQDPAIFDGDSGVVGDTPPDPFVSALQCDASTTTLTLAGTVFQLPRDNIMSYWEVDQRIFTPDQVRVVRKKLASRPLTDVPPSSRVSVIGILYDPPGPDVLGGEHVVIKNQTADTVSMDNWTLRDLANHKYTFKGFNLAGGAEVRIWTKKGQDGGGNLYMGREQAVWNNTGDTAMLSDARGC